jgi:hypothetical protein
MAFNIGSQQAGVINNVAGDQTIHGGQNVTMAVPAAVAAAMHDLRREVEAAALPAEESIAAKKQLDAIEYEMRRQEPDKPAIGRRLLRLTKVFMAAGALVTSGTSLLSAITCLATWLGTAGAKVLRVISA